MREELAEEGADGDAGVEVAGFADDRLASIVVAELRMIESQFHEAREADGVRGRAADLVGDDFREGVPLGDLLAVGG